MTGMSRRSVGKLYEDLAASHLIAEGHSIIEQNFTTRQGEIDIISIYRGTLVFTEVKFRKDSRYGSALSAVSRAKQEKMVKTALVYMKKTGYPETQSCRFDVIGIDAQGHIEHVRNAILPGNVMNRQQSQVLNGYKYF